MIFTTTKTSDRPAINPTRAIESMSTATINSITNSNASASVAIYKIRPVLDKPNFFRGCTP